MKRSGLLDDTKAGLEAIDLDTINRIIARETSGTAKSLRMAEKERDSFAKSLELEQCAGAITATEVREAIRRADQMIKDAVTGLSNWRNVIAVVDFDCFYASVEERDNPSLKGVPLMIIGGAVVSASNYEARKYGVRSAMPAHVARSLCPHIKAISAQMDKYVSVSHAAGAIFAQYDEDYVMHGLDECTLNLTSYVQRYAYEKYGIPDVWNATEQTEENKQQRQFTLDSVVGTRSLFKTETEPGVMEVIAAEVMYLIRRSIHNTLGITCSAGVAINQQVAKIITDMNKPDGQTIAPLQCITVDNYASTLHNLLKGLSIRKLQGIGDASAQLFSREPFSITTIGDIYAKRGLLSLLLTQAQSRFYILSSMGMCNIRSAFGGHSIVPKSIGKECTFPETSDDVILLSVLRSICKVVSQRLQEYDLVPTRIDVKVRFADWINKTHVVDLSRHSWDLDALYKAAIEGMNYIREQKKNEIGYCTSVGDGEEGVSLRDRKYLTVGFGIHKRLARCTDIRLLSVYAHTFIVKEDNSTKSVLYQLNRAGRGCSNSLGCKQAQEREEEIVTITSSSDNHDCEKKVVAHKKTCQNTDSLHAQKTASNRSKQPTTAKHTKRDCKKHPSICMKKQERRFIIGSKPQCTRK